MKESTVYAPTKYACPFCNGVIGYEHYFVLPWYDQEHYVCESCQICFIQNNLKDSKKEPKEFGAFNKMPHEKNAKSIPLPEGIDEFEDVLRVLKLRAFE